MLRFLQHWIEYTGYSIIYYVLRALPLETGVALSAWLWCHLAPRFYRHERARHNIQRAMPTLKPAEVEGILDGMWANLGATMAESLQLDRIIRDPSRIEINPIGEVGTILNTRGESIFVSGHLGSWEISAIAVSSLGIEIAGVYQKVLNPYVERDVFQSRLPFYRAGLFMKGHHAVIAFKNALKNGQSIALMADLRDVRGYSVDFFGIPAPSTTFPALLARYSGAPIIGARTVRIGKCRFRVDLVEIPVVKTDDRDNDLAKNTTSIQKVLESWISEHPDQWMWAHRRWDVKALNKEPQRNTKITESDH